VPTPQHISRISQVHRGQWLCCRREKLAKETKSLRRGGPALYSDRSLEAWRIIGRRMPLSSYRSKVSTSSDSTFPEEVNCPFWQRVFLPALWRGSKLVLFGISFVSYHVNLVTISRLQRSQTFGASRHVLLRSTYWLDELAFVSPHRNWQSKLQVKSMKGWQS
jgi:hypothetical protein